MSILNLARSLSKKLATKYGEKFLLYTVSDGTYDSSTMVNTPGTRTELVIYAVPGTVESGKKEHDIKPTGGNNRKVQLFTLIVSASYFTGDLPQPGDQIVRYATQEEGRVLGITPTRVQGAPGFYKMTVEL